MRLSTLRLVFSLLLCVVLTACSRTPLTHQEAFVFGTRVEVLVYGAPEAQARQAIAAVLQDFDGLHQRYHAWQPSELTALNTAIAAGKAHTVSPELAELIRTAQSYAALGEHLFDPGIGRLIALWGFQSDNYAAALPPANELAAWQKARPSIADLTVKGNAISSRNTSVALDFGGYLKGVALDRAVAILKQHQINNALINIGGNVMALGSKGDQPWRIGIQHPRPQTSGGEPLATLALHDGEAIGTSGDYQRYFELDGQRYCHLLDPRSAAPAQGTQAISVLISPSDSTDYAVGMRSDAASKPLFIAGDDWLRLASKLGVSHALRVDAKGKITATPAMQQRLASPDRKP